MRVRGKPVSTGVLGREGELPVAALRSCFPAGAPAIYSERCINLKLNGSTPCPCVSVFEGVFLGTQFTRNPGGFHRTPLFHQTIDWKWWWVLQLKM